MSSQQMNVVNTAFYRGRPNGYWRDAAGMLVLVAMAAAGGFAINFAMKQAGGAWLGAVCGLAICSPFVWYRWVSGALLQNTPENAQLVPGLNRRIRRASAFIWCLCMAPLVVLAPQFSNGPLLMVVAGMLITVGSSVAAASANGVSASALLLTMIVSPIVLNMPDAMAVLSNPLVQSVLFLLCMGCVYHTLVPLFPAGGDRHIALAGRQENIRMLLHRGDPGKLERSGGRRLPWIAWLLRHDVARPGARSTLMLHALGPAGHHLAFLPTLLLNVAMAVILSILFYCLNQPLFASVFGGIISLFISPLMDWSRLNSALLATRSEQALVRLSPAAPGLRDFNGIVALGILKGRLLQWLLNAAALIGLLAMLAPWGVEYSRMLIPMSMLVCVLPLTVRHLRDFSRLDKDRQRLTGMQKFGFCCLAAYCIAMMLSSEHLLRWSAMALALVIGTASLGLYRWRSVVKAAPAFPSGYAA